MKVVTYLAAFVLVFLAGPAFSDEHSTATASEQNMKVAHSINAMINTDNLQLNYPQITEDFYASQKFQAFWSVKSSQRQVKEAISLLGAVEEFGLNPAGYHVDELHSLQDLDESADAGKAARFELYLTDAMISLINHLHYGKLNPQHLNKPMKSDFALSVLKSGIESGNLWAAVEKAQPQSAEYQSLLSYIRKNKVSPSSAIYKDLAVNLERLRWEGQSAAKVTINIPSFSLQFKSAAKDEEFKVIVGKTSKHTIMTNASMAQFTTTPYWSVPDRIVKSDLIPAAKNNLAYLKNSHYQVYDLKGNMVEHTPELIQKMASGKTAYKVRQSMGCDSEQGEMIFRFEDGQQICLHDTPDRKLFKESNRALSEGCILVENPQRLAALLLKDDGAATDIRNEFDLMVNKNQTRNFVLRNTPTITVRYQTCEVKNGELVKYEDIYQEDQALARALFGAPSESPVYAVK